ncbi:MAG: PDDEXK nuclease domain-containing protein [Bacteroidales bacterium]|nr:PDDEXK nuclease domain-containing protein [Bacteroidales bacterium]
METKDIANVNVDALFERISALIEESRKKVATAVNIAEVYTKYEIGRYIVEDEQEGKARAAYGKQVLPILSQKLTDKFGGGWSLETLKSARKFYSVYAPLAIGSTALTKSAKGTGKTNLVNSIDQIQIAPAEPHKFVLSWSHYLVLMRIKDDGARSFYEEECAKQNWGVRWLQRQVGSSLYERIALSSDRDKVVRMAKEGEIIEKPADIIKNPVTLEFLGLKPDAAYSETKLENAIIDKMQTFLLEMGKGFLFEARQKRFTFDEDNFYVDLVFYNRLLQCYVLIDLKVDKLTHQDLGQMQMYVNYYDRYKKQDFEKPTVGILLCKEKNDTLVELTLPKDSNVYAAQYELYLPDKKELQAKLKSWIEEFEEQEEKNSLK